MQSISSTASPTVAYEFGGVQHLAARMVSQAVIM